MKRLLVCALVALSLSIVAITATSKWSPICAAYSPDDLLYWWYHCWDPPECSECKAA
jgi:hypothetical protein